MAQFSAKDVQALRQATGAGMMDAKKALVERDGDFEEAARWLREKGLGKAAERSDRENTQGAVAIGIAGGGEGTGGSIVELRCETDFVAKSHGFTAVVQRLADAVAAGGVSAVDEHRDAVDDLRLTLKENIALGQVLRLESTNGTMLDSYLHRQDGRGVNAVLVELAGGSAELAHDVAVHVAFARPAFLGRADVPADDVAAERTTLEQITRAEGKPEAAMAKIVEGRLNAWFKGRVLLEQPFVRDDRQTVADHLGAVRVVRFAQVVVGG